jgi:hypothetical protein
MAKNMEIQRIKQLDRSALPKMTETAQEYMAGKNSPFHILNVASEKLLNGISDESFAADATVIINGNLVSGYARGATPLEAKMIAYKKALQDYFPGVESVQVKQIPTNPEENNIKLEFSTNWFRWISQTDALSPNLALNDGFKVAAYLITESKKGRVPNTVY